MKTPRLFSSFARGLALLLSLLVFALPSAPAADSGTLPKIYAFNVTGMTTINQGETAELNWSVGDATEVTITPDVGVVTGTSVEVTPQVTTTYVLTARNAHGFTARSKRITVIAPPVITAFTATPAAVTAGAAVRLDWTAPGATWFRITADHGSDPGQFFNHTTTVRPTVTTTYTITANNPAGTATRTLTVPVTAPGPKPVISAFSASPATIDAGPATTLSWTVGHATSLSLSPGVGPVTGNSITLRPEATTTYTLSATNADGSTTRKTKVTVRPAPLPPAPTIHAFTADPAAIAPGGSATLAWAVEGATRLVLSPDLGEVTGTSITVSPAATRTYELTATNAGGSTTRTVTVDVLPPATRPVITAFAAAPASVSPGGATTLSWAVDGAETVSIAADQGAGPGVVTGTSVSVSPAVNTTYTLTATNPTGSTTRTVSVAVLHPTPVIDSFTATPASIPTGASSTLAWTVTGATSLHLAADISANPGAVTGPSLAVSPAATTVYTLTAANPNGATAVRSATVTVTAPPPAPAIEITSFTASAELIQAGEEVTLRWETVNAQSLWLSASFGGDVGDMRGRTSVVVRPMATTRYVLNAFHSTYGSVAKAVTVNVGPAPVPVINAFAASPATIPIGQSTTLSWSVDGADELTITADAGPSPGPVTGTSLTVAPAEDTIYTLRARNTYGEVTRVAPVIVTGPTAPVIGSFTANPAFIQEGQGSTLLWSVAGADSLTITADAGPSPGPVTGTSVAVTPTASTVYTLTATNTIGSTTATVPVTLYTGGGDGVPHPRIWITPARSAQLAQRAAANDPAWLALRDACDHWAGLPVAWPDENPAGDHIRGGYQYFDYFRPVADLALGFQVAQHLDPVRAGRYAAKAREVLLKLSDPVRHGRESTDRGWSIRAYVPALALGYDWLYPTLSAADRAQIYTEINRWVEWFDANGLGRDYPTGNYFAGYYSAKALGALATEGDNPKAAAMWDDWLNRLHRGLVVPYHAQWLSGGGAPDGWNYGPFETINMVRPAAAAFTAKGLDLLNGAQPFTYPDGHARWMTHFTWPDLSAVSDRGFLYPGSNPSGTSAAWATQYAGLLRVANAAATPIAQQFMLDLRARPGRDRAEAWAEFLFFDAGAPARDYRTDLSYRTLGDGQVSMRNSWAADTVWATFQAGPYTGSPESAEQFYDQGSLTIQRGHIRFVVNAWGEMFRHTPGTEDGEERQGGLTPFDQLYTELYGDAPDGVLQGRRLFNTFYSHRVIRGNIVGFFGQVGAGPGHTAATLARFEDGGRYVLARGTGLGDMYFDPEPILRWERTVVYVRPQVFVVHDRTLMSSVTTDNWMAWNIASAPALVSSSPEAAVFDVVDRRAAYGGNLFRGRMTALLPAGRVVNPVNLFNRGKVYRMEIRPGAATAATNWLTVFDAAGSAATAGAATPLTAAAGTVLAGGVEGALIAGADGRNTAVLFSTDGRAAAGAVNFLVPVADTFCVVSDLAPQQGYTVTAAILDGRLSVQVAPGGDRISSAEGTLSFDVAAPAGR